MCLWVHHHSNTLSLFLPPSLHLHLFFPAVLILWICKMSRGNMHVYVHLCGNVYTGLFWDYHHRCWPRCEWSRPHHKAGAIRDNVSYWHTASRALSPQAWGTQGAKKSTRPGLPKHTRHADRRQLCIKTWQDGQNIRQKRGGNEANRWGRGKSRGGIDMQG